MAEDEGALEARERYNFARAKQKELETVKGFDRMAVSLQRFSTSAAPLIMRATRSRRINLLFPTIAGTQRLSTRSSSKRHGVPSCGRFAATR